MKQEKETAKQHTVKQLRGFQANTRTKKGEAYVAITKTTDNQVSLGWKGTKQDLLNLLFTTCRNDRAMAALICRTAKDHVEHCKQSLQQWVDLTADIGQLDRELDATTKSRKEARDDKGRERREDARQKMDDSCSGRTGLLFKPRLHRDSIRAFGRCHCTNNKRHHG